MDSAPTSGDPSKEQSAESIRGVRLQEFWDKDPEGWLVTVESAFIGSAITQESTKYHKLLAVLPQHVFHAVREIASVPFRPGKYEALKQAILDSFKPSAEIRRREILSIDGLDGRAPGIVLKELIGKARDIVDPTTVINKWVDILPNWLAPSIKVLSLSCAKKLEDDPNDIEQLRDLIATADAMYDQFKNKFHADVVNRSRRNSTSSNTSERSRGRSRGRNREYNPNGRWCQNHFRFRDRAYQCLNPGICTFKPRPPQLNSSRRR